MYLMTLSGTRYLILFPLLTAVLILVELTDKHKHIIDRNRINILNTVICDPLCDNVDVVLVSGQKIRIVDELLWI